MAFAVFFQSPSPFPKSMYYILFSHYGLIRCKTEGAPRFARCRERLGAIVVEVWRNVETRAGTNERHASTSTSPLIVWALSQRHYRNPSAARGLLCADDVRLPIHPRLPHATRGKQFNTYGVCQRNPARRVADSAASVALLSYPIELLYIDAFHSCI